MQELYRTTNRSKNRLVLVTDQPLPPGFVLTVLDTRNGDTVPKRFPVDKATKEGNKVSWEYDGTPWSTAIQLGMERPRATLDQIMVHYDGNPPADGFIHHAVATMATYGYRAWIPGEFPSMDPEKGIVRVTHAKLKLQGEHPGSTVRVRKRGDTNWQGVTAGELSRAIELNANSPNTHVYIEVTDGDAVKTYLLNIDPPPRTYWLSPTARVLEGQESALTLILSEPAPAGGVEFTVTAAYGTAGPDDVVLIPSPVTVPEGADTLVIAVPTWDDDQYEGDESFTLTVSATRPGWAVNPEGTAAATVTILDNDDAPVGPEPRNVRVSPGDGVLTVSWTVAPREGVADGEIRHALRWSQESGVWANPKDPKNIGKNDGITVPGGMTGYVITGLRNGVATGVFVRSYTGARHDEQSPQSSRWVRVKGENTTPRGAEQRQQAPARTYSVTAAASATEGGAATLNVTLSQAAPEGGVEFGVAAGYSGDATATADDIGGITSPVTVAQGNTTLEITIPTAEDAVDEEDEIFTVTITAVTAGWERAGDGLDTARVTIADDDTAGITVTAAAPFNLEEGGTGTYTVALDTRPTADVTITAYSDDSGAAAVSPATHTFTPSAWNTPLTFTVSGVADDDTNEESVGISHWITSDDWKYAVVPVDAVSVSVSDTTQEQQDPPNQAPKVSSAIADVTIGNQSGTKRVSLSGVFSDADNDPLTITAASSDRTRAAVSVAADNSGLTVTAKSRGTATITVTAKDGKGGTVADTFTVKVKAAPVVAQPLADVSLEAGGNQDVSLSGVFSDADGDALTITAASSDDAKATVTVAANQSKLTMAGVAAGTATITVTARDSDGNRVSETFDAPVARKHAAFIAKVKEWRNDPCCVHNKEHTDRWDRVLLAFGETVSDTTLTPMTAAEAQTYADRGWTRWVEAVAALKELEGG